MKEYCTKSILRSTKNNLQSSKDANAQYTQLRTSGDPTKPSGDPPGTPGYHTGPSRRIHKVKDNDQKKYSFAQKYITALLSNKK